MSRTPDLIRTALHLYPDRVEHSRLFEALHRPETAMVAGASGRSPLSANRDERVRFGV